VKVLQEHSVINDCFDWLDQHLLDLIWLVMNLLIKHLLKFACLLAGHTSLHLKDKILLNKLKKSWSGCCEYITYNIREEGV
jgi:hypothetical protein